MEHQINESVFSLVLGDVTKQGAEGVVNSANPNLLIGSGVSGAIHRAAGKSLQAECQTFRREKLGGKPLPFGAAFSTAPGELPCKRIIHTAGPVWGKTEHPEEMLAFCYRSCLLVAAEEGLSSVCFPSISTGVHAFPLEKAAEICVKTVLSFLRENKMSVRMALFSQKDLDAYAAALAKEKLS